MVKAIINEYTENTYVINQKKEVLIIDPGAHFLEIDAYIKENEYDVKGILLTHGHFDHLYTLEETQKAYDCPVYIFIDERDFLFNPNLNLSSSLNKPIIFKNKDKVITLDKDSVITLGKEQITLIHTPGHSRGSVCYKYKRFLFSGDTLFKGTIGRTDLPTSNKKQLMESLKLILKVTRDNTVVYPGHGNFTTILNEKHENQYLRLLK
ncbi:putative metallo-hydrolase [Candidatus Izimaplasma bacterium HR1]|uniref:MBL fold metallo-hydrolase n=1 Tax=Candidatus Izimoplasma sp. HR1 TaxID=1541959 RepID=UPI0004F7E086|nr:putative metallo-hydrolase [Candidatus Izimaplasma bacterium HR1]